MSALQKFLKSETFHFYVFGVILFNALILGLQTLDTLSHESVIILNYIELTLVIFFICEVFLRIIVNFREFFRNGWDLFDLLIVCLCIIPHLRSLSILRTFRVLEKLPHMSNILTAIRNTSFPILIVILIMMILFYTFGVIGVRLYGETAPVRFAGLEWAFLSLAQIMVGDAYGDIIRNVIQKDPSGWLYFIIVTVMFTFVVVNLFIGLVVGAIQSGVISEKKNRQTHTDLLKELNDRIMKIESKIGKKNNEK